MVNLFKKKSEEIKEIFKVGDYDFSIDHENSVVETDGNEIVDLHVKANEEVFNELCENDDFEFNYGLYSPEFYARKIDLGKKRQIVINEKNQSDYESALYFMEHNDVDINLSIHEEWILVIGWTFITGKKYPLIIRMKK
ncbi:MAG: hypothetical protein QNJ57_07005 [Flavobacteriaceae bacterium]|nr:hypothetical protein [Flavobacteriaceae bacterium]